MPRPTKDFVSSKNGVNDTLAGTVTWSHTCSGSNRLLFVSVSNVMGYPPTATYGGVAMVPVHMNSGSYNTFLWALSNPPLGTHDIVVRWTHTPGAYEPVGEAISLNGANTISPYRTPVDAGASSNSPAVTVETGEDELVLLFLRAGLLMTEGAGLTEEIYQPGSSFQFNRMQIASSEQSVNTWTLTGSNAWAVIGLSVKPVGSGVIPLLPAEETFKDRITRAGTVYCNLIDTYHADWLSNGNNSSGANNIKSEGGDASHYYDGTSVLYKIAKYMNASSPWVTAAQKQWDVLYNSYYLANNYGVPGYRFFTEGPWRDYLYRGNATTRNAVKSLRDGPAYNLDTNDLAHTVVFGSGDMLQRELGYHIRAHIHTARLRHTSRSVRYSQLIGWAYGYFNHWFTTPAWQGTGEEMHPFMVGVLARALIEDWEVSRDVRCLPAMQAACNFLWDDCWFPLSMGMGYQLNPLYTGEGAEPGQGRSTSGAAVLNNLIGPMYAFVGWQANDKTQMDRADLMFAGSTFCQGDQVGKQFNQQHAWTFDQLRWRNEFYTPSPRRHSRIRGVV